MSVFENVAFGLRVKPRRERPSEAVIRKKVMDLLDLVQLGWLADRSPAQLSGGQRQRVALARALAVEPQVLLLDEPFGALDAKVRKELRRWLRQLHDELHITSIFVTHDQEEALELADRVVLMNAGRVEQVDTPRQVYDDPASAFVYGFLGSSNVFRGRVEGGLLAVDGARLDLGDVGLNDREIAVYVRPHDFTIERGAEGRGIAARVSRVLELGALARVELTRQTGSGPALPLEVEIPRQEAERLGLTKGETVRLLPRHVRVFPANTLAGAA